jgi:hypothetical protein
MAEPSDCIARFESLARRIPELARAQRLSPEFVVWHRDLLAAVEECFGPESTESVDVRALEFEISPEQLKLLTNTLADPEKLDDKLRGMGKRLGAGVKRGLSDLSERPEGWLEGIQQQRYLKTLG